MEDMLIDTDIIIEYLRSENKTLTTLIKLLQRFNVFISSITEFELYLGAKTERHFKDLELLFTEMEILPFDFGCGQIAANIWKELRIKHQHIEIKDIFIASIAIHNDMWLYTFNKKHFQPIKDVKLWNNLI
jgi:predicted nucleic acid-binding protein